MNRTIRMAAAFWLASALAGTAAAQQRSTADEIKRYREALGDGNPAELWEARGEALWKQQRGPRKASLERCDLGLGPGVVKGAYAQLPRYFADTGKVQDLESRLVTCRMTLQGESEADVKKNPFSAPGRHSDMEALVSYIAAESRGMKLNVPLVHASEKEAYELGERIFHRRGGPHDFSCASCHADSGKRIRLQDLPKLTDPQEARSIFTAWPAYRGSQGTVRTMQHRLYDCFWQMRHPQLDYTSETATALMVYMAQFANGGEMTAPSFKR